MKRGGKLKAGRRMKAWQKAWRFLKPEFEKRGRTSCEFGFIDHECSHILTPAHSRKRRMMQGNDVFAVALACTRIHDFLDLKCTHAEMQAFVEEAINLAGGLILPDLDL